MKRSFRNPPARLSWLWALLPLLLGVALTIPLLNVDAFNGDEPYTLVAAGVLRAGPLSLVDTWNSVSPRQALGWPSLIAIWGRLVGWSEVAVRALPVFFGMLALAWVYRTGRDLLAPRAGLFATLVLSASVFFIAYMIHARAFTLVALCTALCIWSYWRIALHPLQPGRGAQAGLLLACISLLYSHYLGALLLPVLGLYHLLFVPKNRRWWRPVLLFGLATLVAALQIPFLLRGVANTEGEDLASRFLAAPAFLSRLLNYMTNGLVAPSPPFSDLLLLILPLAFVTVTLWILHSGKGAGATWLLVFASATLLALVIAINEVLKVIAATRIRYLMPLLPLSVMLAGAGLCRIAGKHRHLVVGLLAFWLILGAHLILDTDFRYGLGYFRQSNLHMVSTQLSENISASDLLMSDKLVSAAGTTVWLYAGKTGGVVWKTIHRNEDDPYAEVRPVIADYPYAWLLYLTKDRAGFADLSQQLGRVLCERVLDDWGYSLERYALHSVKNCPDRTVRLVFDSDIQLTAPEITVSDGLLRLDAHFRSADATLLARYSLAIHVIDPRTGERIAQGDTGVGPGAIVPLRSEIDVSALPPGNYDVRVALYDWQTGERLSARDTETGAVSDMHTLENFCLG